MIISIITVCYNSVDELPATIQNILTQSSKQFEYIIVDGASKDGTLEVIEQTELAIQNGEYLDVKPNQFKWISQPDKGLYDAMNKALELATGDFVWFINAGDKLFDSRSVQTVQDAYLSKPSCDVLYSQALVIDENDQIIGERHKRAPIEMNFRSLLNGLVVSHQAIVVKRSLAPQYNLKYRISADYDWVCRILRRSQLNVYIPGNIALFQTGGLSSQKRSQSWCERYSIMRVHFGWFKTIMAHILIILKYPFTQKNG